MILDNLGMRDKMNLMLANSWFLNICRRSIYFAPHASILRNECEVSLGRHPARARRRSDPWSELDANANTSNRNQRNDQAQSSSKNPVIKAFNGLISMLGRRSKSKSAYTLFMEAIYSHKLNSQSKVSFPVGSFVRVLDIDSILGSSDKFGDHDLKAILDVCPEVTRLNLSNCAITDTALMMMSVSNAAKNLISLNLSGCADISDLGIKVLSQACPKLESINLKNCINITDQAIVSLGYNCNNLQRLRLNGCEKLTDECLVTIANYNLKLRWLDVGLCSGIGDEGVSAIVGSCQHLQWLDLSRPSPKSSTNARLESIVDLGYTSQNITDETIIKIAENCRELELVDLSYCTAITDDGLLALANNAKLLRSLSLKGMPYITRISILALGSLRKAHRKLSWLQVYQCKQINAAVIDEMIAKLQDGWRKGPYDVEVHREVMNGKTWDDTA